MPPRGRGAVAGQFSVSPNFFRMIGSTLRTGREFQDSDTGTSLLWGAAGDDELRGRGDDDRALFSNPIDADLARGTATGEAVGAR